MTDKEVIEEFSRVVRSTIKARGKLSFATSNLQETEVAFKPFRLTHSLWSNGERLLAVFSHVHHKRVFFESNGGPGQYGVGERDDEYDIEALRELLPQLRALTVLEQLADV